jgi:hypothetical protein
MLADFLGSLSRRELRRLAVPSVISRPSVSLLSDFVKHTALRCGNLLTVVRLNVARSMCCLFRHRLNQSIKVQYNLATLVAIWSITVEFGYVTIGHAFRAEKNKNSFRDNQAVR